MSPSVADADAIFLSPPADTREVKEVTRGVEEVELDDKLVVVVGDAAPETIPLPEETAGELDEPASDDVDEAPTPTPTDDARVSDSTESAQVAAEQSSSTLSLTEDRDGEEHNEEAIEEPTPDAAEPMNEQQAQGHP